MHNNVKLNFSTILMTWEPKNHYLKKNQILKFDFFNLSWYDMRYKVKSRFYDNINDVKNLKSL